MVLISDFMVLRSKSYCAMSSDYKAGWDKGLGRAALKKHITKHKGVKRYVVTYSNRNVFIFSFSFLVSPGSLCSN